MFCMEHCHKFPTAPIAHTITNYLGQLEYSFLQTYGVLSTPYGASNEEIEGRRRSGVDSDGSGDGGGASLLRTFLVEVPLPRQNDMEVCEVGRKTNLLESALSVINKQKKKSHDLKILHPLTGDRRCREPIYNRVLPLSNRQYRVTMSLPPNVIRVKRKRVDEAPVTFLRAASLCPLPRQTSSSPAANS